MAWSVESQGAHAPRRLCEAGGYDASGPRRRWGTGFRVMVKELELSYHNMEKPGLWYLNLSSQQQPRFVLGVPHSGLRVWDCMAS